jgi:hypothetical protein
MKFTLTNVFVDQYSPSRGAEGQKTLPTLEMFVSTSPSRNLIRSNGTGAASGSIQVRNGVHWMDWRGTEEEAAVILNEIEASPLIKSQLCDRETDGKYRLFQPGFSTSQP